MDFVADQFADARRFRALTILDLFYAGMSGDRCRPRAERSRCRRHARTFALRARTTAAHLLRQWYRVRQRGDGSAAHTNGVILDFSRRGKPPDNAAIESFNGRLREECLNVHCASIDDAQQKIDAFRWDYNEHHPSSISQGLSPREFAERMLQTVADSLSW